MTLPAPPSTAELPTRVDAVVIGAGLVGSAAAWHLARRGHEVLQIEQYAPATTHGSSHGSARIIRRAYPQADYVRLTGEAFQWWRELEHESGRRLLRITGGLDHGALRKPETIAARLAEAGVEHEMLSATEAAGRYPGMVFDGPVLYHPQAGTLDAEWAVDAFVSGMGAHGGRLVCDTTAQRLTPTDDHVVVHTSRGQVRARRAVLAAGAWVEELAGGLFRLPPLWVTEHQVFHFPRADTAIAWPVTVHREGLNVYHLPGGRDGGPGDARKIAEHRGRPTTASTRSAVVDPASRERITEYVRQWLPGLIPEPHGETTCLYTSTQDEDFIIDKAGPLVLASACSGHGAKLASVVGRVAADLAEGGRQHLPRFQLSHHLQSIQPHRTPTTVRR